jgi:MYXO-CTERM domain-containing protein
MDCMNRPLCRTFVRASGLLASAFFTLGAQAAVTTYTSSAGFLANTTTTNLATFEGLPFHSQGASLATNGITITSLPGGNAIHDVYIAPASSGLYFAVPNTSAALTANGDENFRFQLTAGGTFGSIGFDFYSNPYNAPVFALYDSSSVLIQSIAVPQAVSSLGFIGFTSTTPIAYITTTVDRGWVVDTGYDNLRIGSVTAVPEPHAGWLLLAGLAAVAGSIRRRVA